MLLVTDWRGINLALAGLCVAGAAVLLTVAPRHVAPPSGETLASQIKGIGKVYGDGYFWRTTPWAFISIGVSQGVGTMYVLSWLTQAAGQTVSAATNVLFAISLASIVNYLLVGQLMQWLTRRGFGPMTVPYAGIFGSMLVLAAIVARPGLFPAGMWVLWALSIGWTSLTVASLARAFPVRLAGRVYTGFNQLSFLMTSAIQWLVGWLVDFHPGADGHGAPEGYRLAFAAVLGIQLLGLAWTVAARLLRIGERTMIERGEDV
jgi:hypothetical protein